MKKCSLLALATIAILVTMSLVPSTLAAPNGSRWVLVDVEDIPNYEKWNEANTSAAYTYEEQYARGSYSVKTTYKGKTDYYYTPPYIHGEALTVHASWSQPPQIINPGETVMMHLRLGILSNSQSAFKFSGSTRAWLGGANMTNVKGKHHFECNFGTGYATVNDTVSSIARSGSKEGDKLELEVSFYSSIPMYTKYIYEWTAADKLPVDPTTHNWVPVKPQVPAKAQVPAKTQVDEAWAGELYPPGPVYDKNGELMDTGIKASDMYGECTYLLPGLEDDQWELLELGTVLPVNTKIRTREESGVILSMPDMTTFELKPDSTLILTQRTGKRNALKILAGNIITNIKKMVTDGTMEVEMSQAIAGARGTTFVCTEDENGSTLKVLEGTVELTPNGKVPIVVNAGEAISTKLGTVGQVVKFSAAQELSTWSGGTQERISGILAAKGITLKDAEPRTITLTIGQPTAYLDGKPLELGVKPYVNVMAGRTYVPIRFISEALGAQVQWVDAKQQIVIRLGDRTIILAIGSNRALVNGAARDQDCAPEIIDPGRTMVPVRLVSELLGAVVDYNDQTGEIRITMTAQ